MSAFTAQRYNIAGRLRRCGAILAPLIHQLPALVELVSTLVGSLRLTAGDVSKRQFANFTWIVGALRSPVAEATAEAMHGDVASPHAATDNINHCTVAQAAFRPNEHKRVVGFVGQAR